MDNNYNDMTQVPLGLAFGMAMDKKAFDNYANLTEAEKEKIIARCKGVKSKEEMNEIINKLDDGTMI